MEEHVDLLISIPIVLVAIVLHEAWGHKLFGEVISKLKPTFVAVGIPINTKPLLLNIKGWRLSFPSISTVFYTWNRKGKIPVVFSWLLIGGGVGFEDKEFYSTDKYWQKIVMIIAGPLVNFSITIGLLSLFINADMTVELVQSYAAMTLDILKSFVTSQTAQQAVQLSQFYELTYQMAETTVYWEILAYFAMWNISIAVVNLLPVPGLDGGQILGITLIKIVGERAIVPVKIVSTFCAYILIAISTVSTGWWIGKTIYDTFIFYLA